MDRHRSETIPQSASLTAPFTQGSLWLSAHRTPHLRRDPTKWSRRTRKNGEAERAFAARRRRNLAGQPNKVVAPRQRRTGKRSVPSPPAGGEISRGNSTKWLCRDKEERGSGTRLRRPQAAKSRGATQQSGCAATRKNGEAERAFAARRRRNLAGQPNKVVAPRQGRTGKRNVPSPPADGEISRGNPTKWLRRDKEERRSGCGDGARSARRQNGTSPF